MLTLSAIDRKYLLKASAMSYWVLLILPSVFKDSIAAMLLFYVFPNLLSSMFLLIFLMELLSDYLNIIFQLP